MSFKHQAAPAPLQEFFQLFSRLWVGSIHSQPRMCILRYSQNLFVRLSPPSSTWQCMGFRSLLLRSSSLVLPVSLSWMQLRSSLSELAACTEGGQSETLIMNLRSLAANALGGFCTTKSAQETPATRCNALSKPLQWYLFASLCFCSASIFVFFFATALALCANWCILALHLAMPSADILPLGSLSWPLKPGMTWGLQANAQANGTQPQTHHNN